MEAITPEPTKGEATLHSLLILESARWLKRKNHTVVITDMTHAGPETADAIGWRGKWSTLIECKTSRSDFMADKKKHFRRQPDFGMGNRRYFCTPAGLIKPEELPEGWGLLEWREQQLRQVVEARHHAAPAKIEEVSLLISAVRRIGKGAPKGISVRCYKGVQVPGNAGGSPGANRGCAAMKDNHVQITCPCCCGSGKIPLCDESWRTLLILRRAKRPLTTNEIPHPGVSRNAINNQLTRMEAAGLVERRGKAGKFILWAAKG